VRRIIWSVLDFLVAGLVFYAAWRLGLTQLRGGIFILLYILADLGFCAMTIFVLAKRRTQPAATRERLDQLSLLATVIFALLGFKFLYSLVVERSIEPTSLIILNTLLPVALDFLLAAKQTK